MKHEGNYIVDVSDPQEPHIRFAENVEQLHEKSDTDCLMNDNGGPFFPSFEDAREVLCDFCDQQAEYFKELALEVAELTYEGWQEIRKDK